MPDTGSVILIGHVVLALAAIISVLRNRKDPNAMLAWIFTVVMLPLLGVVLYAAFGSDRVQRRATRKRRRIAHLLDRLQKGPTDRVRDQHDRFGSTSLPEDLRSIEQLGLRLSNMPATGGNEVHIYQEAEQTYAALEQAIRDAKHHVHLLYYIWQPDETGHHFRDLLMERLREGVQCRVLLDAVGCWRVRKRFLQPLIDAGCHLSYFMPLYPLRRRWSPHLRNHRKIAVADGRVAFVGSQNIGDEYRGRLKRLSPWVDSHMRVTGPAALYLQQTFVEDWLFATRETLRDPTLFPAPGGSGDSVVQILPTGPESDVSGLEQILFAAVSTATTSIRIATPYFVPSRALLIALIHACYRGVRVQLVLPTRSDSLLVLWAGRSYYAELLDAGVELFEFDGGMLHSKIVTVDDRWCLLGTANMDVRSFRLNFEITAVVYDEQVSRKLSASIESYCAKSRNIGVEGRLERGIPGELLEGAARLFAPLL